MMASVRVKASVCNRFTVLYAHIYPIIKNNKIAVKSNENSWTVLILFIYYNVFYWHKLTL